MNVLSPITLTTRRASLSGSVQRRPSPTVMPAPMHSSVSIASNGGSVPRE